MYKWLHSSHKQAKNLWDKCTGIILPFYFFFFTLLLYSKMHWLDMSSIARQYIHISYTDVLSNVFFIVTNFTLNIFFNHLLFLTNNSHVTLSSQCIRSHSVEKYIPVLCSICLSKRVFSKVCALSLYTGFPYIQSGFMQSYGHVWHLNSTVFSFLPLLPLPKKVTW